MCVCACLSDESVCCTCVSSYPRRGTGKTTFLTSLVKKILSDPILLLLATPPPPTNNLAPQPIVIVIINENDSCRRCRGSGPLSVTAAEVADAHLP